MSCVADDTTRSAVIEANRIYHAALAPTYEEKQPHFRPENVERASRMLHDLSEKAGGGTMLDLGCGTGFLTRLAEPYFDRAIGVDITVEMLERAAVNGRRGSVYRADTGVLPFEDDTFSLCTAYSFLHHLHDLEPTLAEACRCLRPGGLFWADADPNAYFFDHISGLGEAPGLDGVALREYNAIVTVADAIADDTGLTPEQVRLAEYQKMEKGGFYPDAVAEVMRRIGFTDVEYRYDWFLGQAKVLHHQPAADLNAIESYLREGLPATRHLFKYVSFTARKGAGA